MLRSFKNLYKTFQNSKKNMLINCIPCVDQSLEICNSALTGRTGIYDLIRLATENVAAAVSEIEAG